MKSTRQWSFHSGPFSFLFLDCQEWLFVLKYAMLLARLGLFLSRPFVFFPIKRGHQGFLLYILTVKKGLLLWSKFFFCQWFDVSYVRSFSIWAISFPCFCNPGLFNLYIFFAGESKMLPLSIEILGSNRTIKHEKFKTKKNHWQKKKTKIK